MAALDPIRLLGADLALALLSIARAGERVSSYCAMLAIFFIERSIHRAQLQAFLYGNDGERDQYPPP